MGDSIENEMFELRSLLRFNEQIVEHMKKVIHKHSGKELGDKYTKFCREAAAAFMIEAMAKVVKDVDDGKLSGLKLTFEEPSAG